MTASLAYRRHEADILAGNPPEKYLRIVPHIPGERIIEFGSAEGVLALLLAREGKHVTAVELNVERHAAALRLRDHWLEAGHLPEDAVTRHSIGRAQDAVRLIEAGVFDTLVAVRMIYYLRDDIDAVFEQIAVKVPNVVLCGNKQRASWWRQGIPDKSGGAVNYYASHEGMRALLERHGYAITAEVKEGDPIVVGHRE